MASRAGSAPAGMEGLRPMELGELLDRAFTLYRRHFLTFILISALPYVIAYAGAYLWGLAAGTGVAAGRPIGFSAAVLVSAAIGFVLYMIAVAASQAASFYAVSEQYLGRPATFAEAYRSTKGKLLQVIGTTLYVGLAAGVGILLFIIPGIIIMCRGSVAIAATILEDLGPRAAFSRSWELTKGFARRALSILAIASLIGVIAQMIFQFPFTMLAVALRGTPAAPFITFLSSMGQLLATILSAPVAFIASTVFYYDLRVRKEAFDLERLLKSLGGTSPFGGGIAPGPLGVIR